MPGIIRSEKMTSLLNLAHDFADNMQNHAVSSEGDCFASGVAALGVKCNEGACESYVIPTDGGSQ